MFGESKGYPHLPISDIAEVIAGGDKPKDNAETMSADSPYSAFANKTRKMLFNESTKLWMNGLVYIVDEYKREMKNRRQRLSPERSTYYRWNRWKSIVKCIRAS